jgi:hypothetical protein
MTRARRPRKTVSLSSSVHRRLNAYAIAAGASGLALALPAQAEIVYTPANQFIEHGQRYALNLINSGAADFVVADRSGNSTSGHASSLFVAGAPGNSVEGSASRHAFLAAALKQGASIPTGTFGAKGQMAFFCSGFLDCSATTSKRGDWVNVTDRYLGLKFTIDGQTHYGWARFSVKLSGVRLTAVLSGYAYETIADQPILAGATQGTADDISAGASLERESSGVGTLGNLALGWR